MTRRAALLGSIAVLGGLGAAGYFAFTGPERSCSNSAVAGGTATIGGPFQMIDHTGKTVTEVDVIDGLTLVYFGFTFCPDVCPLDTARNLEAIDLLDAQDIKVKPVFVSIDPERDTPDVLADYIEVSHHRMVGLTGSAAQVKAASRAYKTYYRKNGDGNDYLMDHSTFSYLMGPNGFIEVFRRDVTPQAMAETIACHSAKGV